MHRLIALRFAGVSRYIHHAAASPKITSRRLFFLLRSLSREPYLRLYAETLRKMCPKPAALLDIFQRHIFNTGYLLYHDIGSSVISSSL